MKKKITPKAISIGGKKIEAKKPGKRCRKCGLMYYDKICEHKPSKKKPKEGVPMRPPLEEDVVKILEDEFKIDSSVTDACHRAKITRDDYYIEIGRNKDFAYRMKKAQMYVDRMARGAFVNAIALKKNWKASESWLKLRNPRYKPAEKRELTGKVVVQMNSIPKDHPFLKPDDTSKPSSKK